MNKNVGIEYVYKKLIENGMETEKAKKIANELQQETDARRFVPREPATVGWLTLSQAAKKYRLKHQTISRWIKRGYIKQVQRDNWAVYILSDEIANLAEIYKSNPGQGKLTLKQSMTFNIIK